MRRILFAAAAVAITLSACSGSSGPSQSQLAAEKAWSHGKGGKYLADVSAILQEINNNVDSSFTVGPTLAGAALLASAFPPPIDASAYAKVMQDYLAAGNDIGNKFPPDVNGFGAALNAAANVLSAVKPPWGASLPGGKNF